MLQQRSRYSNLAARRDSWKLIPGLALYADLHNPIQQALGRLNNGTGIATEAPAILALGNNTINVTTLGTFLIYVRGSGTATSGSTTITGSPVTLVSGWNTITTTGATGTITIALNNVIVSNDTNKHLMTITGATYGYQGRTVDGDDKITVPLGFTGTNLTIVTWIKPGSDVTTLQGITGSDTGAGSGIWINGGLYRPFHGASQYTVGVTATASTWSFLMATFANLPNLPTLGISLNGVAFVTAASGNNTDIGNIRLFVRNSADTSPLLAGTMGEVFYYSRILTLKEGASIMQGTKWRYQ